MKPHEERVVTEKEELNTKLNKLDAFLETSVFKSLQVEDQILLKDQFYVMQRYVEILEKRINRFD